MSIRTKFYCESIQEFITNKNVSLNPVMSGSKENKSFANATPGGKLQLVISPNTDAFNYFKVGQEYVMDITES